MCVLACVCCARVCARGGVRVCAYVHVRAYVRVLWCVCVRACAVRASGAVSLPCALSTVSSTSLSDARPPSLVVFKTFDDRAAVLADSDKLNRWRERGR
eukprot:207536-Pleurochrysis_carterae.AAC.2